MFADTDWTAFLMALVGGLPALLAAVLAFLQALHVTQKTAAVHAAVEDLHAKVDTMTPLPGAVPNRLPGRMEP